MMTTFKQKTETKNKATKVVLIVMFEEAKFCNGSNLLLASHKHSDGACEVVASLDEFDDSSEWPVATRGVFFADEYEVVDTKFRSRVRPFLA